MRDPYLDFIKIKKDIKEIINKNTKEELFYDLSNSLASIEKFILEGDNSSENFLETLSKLIVDYLAFFCKIYGVEDSYKFLESRRHWGTTNFDKEDTYESLVIPFYKLRISLSEYMIGSKKLKIKELYQLAKLEESIEGE